MERSTTTGELCITATKSKADVLAEKARLHKEWREAREKRQ